MKSISGVHRHHLVHTCFLSAGQIRAAATAVAPLWARSGGGSSRSPLAIILSTPFGSGRCNVQASVHGARIHTSHSSSVVKITGIAFGCIGATTSFGSAVRKPYSRCGPSTGFALVSRTPLHSVQIPANASSGRVSSRANHFGVFFGLVSAYSQKDVNGTRHRLSGASHRRQCGDLVLRIL